MEWVALFQLPEIVSKHLYFEIVKKNYCRYVDFYYLEFVLIYGNESGFRIQKLVSRD